MRTQKADNLNMPRCYVRLAIILIVALSAILLTPGCGGQDVAVKPTPITIISETIGHGRPAKAGDVVCIDYRLVFPNGSELLNEKDFSFILGGGSVIAGIDEAVTGMRKGGSRVVDCPPHKHWGSAGYGNGKVPPNTRLTIHVRLVSVEQSQTGQSG